MFYVVSMYLEIMHVFSVCLQINSELTYCHKSWHGINIENFAIRQ